MDDQLRDIANIEPSYFLITIALIAVILGIILFFIIKKLRGNKKEKIDYNKEWKKIISKYRLKNFSINYKKYYENLNKSFREFLEIYLKNKFLGYPLSEVLPKLDIEKKEKEELENALERIYRGDYYYLEENIEEYMKRDFKTVDHCIMAINH
jgi:hypothetical protein